MSACSATARICDGAYALNSYVKTGNKLCAGASKLSQTGGDMIQAVAAQNINRERLVEACEEKDFDVVQDADYDAGRLDIVWNINVHPALPNIKFGFITLGVEEEDGSY